MDWHQELTSQERLRYIAVLIQALKELASTTNNPGTVDLNKLKLSAEEFEKYCFQNATSKVGYINFFRQKVLSIKNSTRSQKMRMGNGNIGINQSQQQQPQQGQPPQQQQPPPQSQQAQRPNNPSQIFLAQQAQARQQAAQQLRSTQAQQAQLQQQPQQDSQNNGIRNNFVQNNTNFNQVVPQQRAQDTQQPQQQQLNQAQQTVNAVAAQNLSQIMKTQPIPPPLLQRIPNLPPNVNTWGQIFTLMSSGQLGQSYGPIVRQVYNVHLQVVQKQQAQKFQPNNTSVNPGISQSNAQQNNDLSAQLRHQQDLRNRQMQQQKQEADLSQNQSQVNPQPLSQPPLTSQELQRLTQNALQLLTKLQNEKQIPPTLTDEQRNLFIKRFIARQQQVKVETMNLQRNQQNFVGTQQNAQFNNTTKPVQSQPQQQQNWNGTGNLNLNQQDSSLTAQQQQLNARRQNLLQQQQKQQQQFQQQALNQIPTQLAQQQPQVSQVPPQQGQNQQQQNQAQAQMRANGIDPNFQRNFMTPTEKDRVELRMILNEVSKVPIKLQNLTNQMNAEQKQIVNSKVQTLLLPLFNLIEQLVPTFYTLTKSIEGTRKLLHMRFMVKEVLDGLRRNEYYASPDLLEKMKSQSQKYVEFVKEQIKRKSAQAGQVPQSQHQSQQPQQIPMPSGTVNGSGTQWSNNAGSSMNGLNPDFTPQQLLQRKQQQINQNITPQQLLQQQQQQQLNYQPSTQTQPQGMNGFDVNMTNNMNFSNTSNIDLNMLNGKISTPELNNAARFNSSPAMPNVAFPPNNNNFNNSPQLNNVSTFTQQPQLSNFSKALPTTQGRVQQQPIQPVPPSTGAATAPSPAIAPKKVPVRRKSKASTTKKPSSGASTPTNVPKTPAMAATPASADSSAQAQLLKKEQEIQLKEDQTSRTFEEYKQKRRDLWLTRPVDSFALALANLLELTDEETKIIDSKSSKLIDSRASPFQKGLTPSAILQTPLTFSNAKTPNSSAKPTSGTIIGNTMYLTSPKQSPSTRDESVLKWKPKVTRDAIVSTFKEVSEIKKLMIQDGFGGKTEQFIPTPPPDGDKKHMMDDQPGVNEDVKKFKKVTLDDANNFYDDEGNMLDNDTMWNNWEYWNTHLQVEDE